MRHSIERILSIILVTACGLLLLPSDGFTAGTGNTVAGLSGWSIPGLETLPVEDVTTGQNLVTGNLSLPGRTCKITLFKVGNQVSGNLVIEVGTVAFSDLFPIFRGTPLDDLSLQNSCLIVVPSGKPLQGKDLPAAVVSLLRLPTGAKASALSFKPGLNLGGASRFIGESAALLQKIGLGADLSLSVTGNFDPGILRSLSGSGGAPQLTAALIDQIDLAIPLPVPAPSWKPAFLSLTDPMLSFRGKEGVIHSAVNATVAVDLPTGKVTFPNTSIRYDPAGRVVTFDSPSIDPGAALSINIAGVAVKVGQLSIQASVSDPVCSFKLIGEALIAGVKRKVSVLLSGNATKAEYAFSLEGTTRLTDLLGWQVPGLDQLAVTEIGFGTGFTSGKIQVGPRPVSLTIFKGARQSKPNLALDLGDLSLAEFIPALQGTPLADLRIDQGAFIAAPAGNAGTVQDPPQPVQQQTKASSLDLKAGLNLLGKVRVSGPSKELLDLVGIPAGALPIGGSMDLSLLAGGGGQKLAAAIINQIDLTIPLPALQLPGLPSFVVLRNGKLRFKGKEGVIVGSVECDATVTAGGGTYQFSAAIGIDQQAGKKSVAIDGTFVGTIRKMFGIDWLTLREVGLRIRLGANKEISILGKTDLGAIKGLVVTSFFKTRGDQIQDAGVLLTGADIPLGAIPGLGRLPNLDRIKFRNLTVSRRAFGGTILAAGTPIAFLDGLTAVLFQGSTQGWTLAVLRNGFSIGDILPLPEPVKAIFRPVGFTRAAFVIGNADLDVELSELPTAAQDALISIFGKPDARFRIRNGLSLISAIDLGPLADKFKDLRIDLSNPVVEGALQGIFSGPPGFELAVVIPPITLPDTLKFIVLPKSVETRFFLRLQGVSAAIGAGIKATTQFMDGVRPVEMSTTLDFQVDTTGGFSIVLQEEMEKEWVNPFGIKGFTLDPGTLIAFQGSVSSNIRLTLTANTHIAKRLVDLSGSIDILGGSPAGLAASGKTSELGTDDLVALVNAMVSAAGQEPPKPSFPPLKLTNVDLAFASPGTIGSQYGLDAGGVRLGGDLWFLLKNEPLCSFKGQVTTRGLEMNGRIGRFKVGPIEMKDNALAVKAVVGIPPEPPFFKINGMVGLFGRDNSGEIQISADVMDVKTVIDLGDLLKFDFAAMMDLPRASLNPAELAQFDLKLHTSLKSDLPAWLRGEGKNSVQKVFGGITQTLNQAAAGLKKAQADVATLDDQIAKNRETVRKEANAKGTSIKEAEDFVKNLEGQDKGFDQKIAAERKKIKPCDQTKKVPVAWNWKLQPTKWKTVPDLVARGVTATENLAHRTAIAGLEGSQKAGRVSLESARKILADLRKGITSDAAIDLDPRIAPLILSREAAMGTLNLAQAATQELTKATQALKKAVDSFARNDVFVLKNALISGSLKKAVAGVPVVAGIDFTVLGEDNRMGLAFSMTDPVFTAKQLEALALLLAVKVLETGVSTGETPQSVLDLVQAEYTRKASEVEDELQKALKESGL